MSVSGARKISIERALRSAQGFARNEWRLALPVALAFLGLPQLIVTLVLMRRVSALQTMADLQSFSMNMPWWLTVLLIAMMLLSALGLMALMALALVPRISVREALLLAFRRFPYWLGATTLLLVGIFMVLMLAMILIALARGGEALATAFIFLAMLGGMLFAVLMLPIAVDRAVTPIALLRDGGHLYGRSWGRLTAGLLIYLVTAWIVMMALQVSAGSMLLLLGRLLTSPQTGTILATVLASVVSAIAWGGFALLVAGLYRQAEHHA